MFLILFSVSVVYAGNPVTPILPSDNIQDPGDPGTAWGGCGPTDSNCYVTITASQWVTTGSDIYYNTGNVGIGNSTPTSELDILISSPQMSVFVINDATRNYLTVNAVADGTNAIGSFAGFLASTNATSSNFIGSSAGSSATNASYSNFFGSNAGTSAANANNSNFFGQSAGQLAGSAANSNFFGQNAGYLAGSASYSNLFGFQAGKFFSGNNIGSNNIIIGTNISLPNTTADAFNIGGVLFGTGTYNTTTGDPSITPTSGGRIGIGTVAPSSKFDVTTTSLGTTQTATSGLALVNTTAAVVGAQQISPAIRWSGSGWKTNATAASQAVDFRSYVLPVQGTANPTGRWLIESSINGGAYGERFGVDNVGGIYINGSAGTNGYVLRSNGAGSAATWQITDSIAFTGLSNGSGTTKNGTAVDLGGNLSGDTTINSAGYSFKISNTERGNGFLSDFTTRITKIGDVDALDLGNIIVVDSVNSIAYYDNIAHTGKFGIGNASPQLMLHVGSASITDATNLLRLEDENSTCDFNADAGGPSCGSDRTLKKNISSLNTVDLLTRVSTLNPVSYQWNTDNESDPIKYGFVAQEVAEQFPDLVTDHTWIDGTTRKFLNTGGLMPYAIGAIKEMNLKVTGIENFDQEDNSFGDKFRTWLANAGNRISRIFTSEICLTDTDGTSECINKNQLGQLKQLLNTTPPPPPPPSGGPTDTPPTDVCPNIEGPQSSIPTGYHIDQNNCVEDTITPPPSEDTPPEETPPPTQDDPIDNPPTL